jgi:hypothetical protein
MKQLMLMLAAALFACNTTTSPTEVTPDGRQEPIIVNPVSPEASVVANRCDAFLDINRRAISGSNVIRVKVEWKSGSFKRVRVKFLINADGLPRFIHIERFVVNGTPFEVELELPKCGVDYQVWVYIEGLDENDNILAQCDGSVWAKARCEDVCEDPGKPKTSCNGTWIYDSVQCKWSCDYDECIEQQCGECQTWDPVACKCTGSCTCTPCETHALSVEPSRVEDTFCLSMDGSHSYVMTANGSHRTYEAGKNKFCWQLDCEETLAWSVAMTDLSCGYLETCQQFRGTEVGECTNECEAPPVQNFTLERPFGSPTSECAYFGTYVPTGMGPAAFWVTKCGRFYEVTHSPWTQGQCTNGQDVSHSTPCWCALED